MQQATRRLVLVLGGAFSISAGLLVAACSTDNGTSSSGALPTVDSGPKKDTGTPGDDDDDTTTDGGDGGPAADCGAAPFLVNNSADAGIFCPFQAAKDAGNCLAATQQCCAPGTFGAPSFCANIVKTVEANNETAARFAACQAQVPDAAAPDGGWDPNNKFNAAWECSDSTSCPAGNVCCATSQPGADATNKVNVGPNQFTKGIPAACNAKQLFKQGGTRCATACNSLELPLCSKNDQCASGQECQAMAGTANSGISTRYLGYCVAKP